jgi:TM2 domain-containing membrane protein YozV
MKKPWLAFLLSFLIAGAGFLYLGKWKWAVINFLGAIAVGIVVAYTIPDQASTVAAGVAVVSGGIAANVARSMNSKQQMRATSALPQG